MARPPKTPSRGTATGHARDYVAAALAFAREAAADKRGEAHCKFIREAAKRFLNDLKRAERKACPFYWSDWHANDVCDFIEKLPHVAGSWDTKTITLEPAQVFILANVFGFRLRTNDRRRFTRAYIEVARKNAKSTLTAGVALYCLTCEGELGPEIVIGATTGQQAGKVFDPCKLMVQRTNALQAAFNLKAWARAVTCGDNDGKIQPINSKSSTQDGWNPFVGILDELHAHKDRGLFDVIRSAFGARKQPLMWMITTAGYNTEGVCYEQRRFLEKVLGGAIEADHYFGVIFTIDEGDDVFDERVWRKANPLLGAAVDLPELRGYAIEAKASPESLGEFKTKRLNIWLNAASNWLNVEKWKKAATALTWADFRGLDCYVGTDLSDKDDITAIVVAAVRPCGQLILKPLFFLPSEVLARESQSETGQSTYAKWAELGGGATPDDVPALPPLFNGAEPVPALPREWDKPMVLTPGDFVDHSAIETFIRWLNATLAVRRVTSDQFAAAQLMASRLNLEFGSADDPLVRQLHKSAANVTDPAKELEARVKAGAHQVAHDGNPVMTWMVSNAVVTRKVDGTIIPKKESPMSPNKIDGVDAAINAIAPIVAQVPQEESPYEDRGLLVV